MMFKLLMIMRDIKKQFGKKKMTWRTVSSINKLQIFLFGVLSLAMFLHIPFTLNKIHVANDFARILIAAWAIVTVIIVVNFIRLIRFQVIYTREIPDSYYLEMDLTESEFNGITNMVQNSDHFEFQELVHVPKFHELGRYQAEGGSEKYLYIGGEDRRKLFIIIGPIRSEYDDDIDYLSKNVSEILWDEE